MIYLILLCVLQKSSDLRNKVNVYKSETRNATIYDKHNIDEMYLFVLVLNRQLWKLIHFFITGDKQYMYW